MKRKVETETNKVQTGTSEAVSSKLCDFFHLVSPYTIRRLARRKTVGGLKYGPTQARIGMSDPRYVADRLNHLFDHLMDFMENGNRDDDNIGGMLWALDFLSDVERLHPQLRAQVLGTCNLSGAKATQYNEKLRVK